MIYTLTLNPSLDYIVQSPNFKIGYLNRTVNETILPGGKGINVSIVLKELGVKSVALGFLAGFVGDDIKYMIDELDIVADFIAVPNGMSRLNVKIRGAVETELNGQGPHIDSASMQELLDKLSHLTSDDVLVLAGNIPRRLNQSIYTEICELVSKNGVCVVVDATMGLLTDTLKYHPFLIKPNHQELGDIFDVEISDKSEAATYARKLQEYGARNVLVSMAGNGAVLVTESGEIFEMDAPKGDAVNSVGAGDSMVAGFLAGYYETKDYEYALKKGVCAGSASAFSIGLATAGDIDRLMKEGIR